ncbi:MAG: nuclear transport factor 2 family protein [Pseudomonadota bacterium]
MSALRFAALVAASLLLPAPQPAYAQAPDSGKQEIAQLVERFQTAIVAKDIAGFMTLFLREDITWNVVHTDDTVKRYNAKLKDPSIPLATRIQAGSPRSFIESIARSRRAKSETISNVRIDTDGEIAQVWFDFAFMIGDYKSAWGKESWQLVRTGDGWKIAAVVWSAEENPQQP